MNSLFGEAYQNWITNIQKTVGPISLVFIIIAIALIGGFGVSRICKLCKIPYVTGYILLGIVIGPCLLSFIPSWIVKGGSWTDSSGNYFAFAGLSFISDLTMGFIAFSCGKYFKFKNIKEAGSKVIIVSLLTSIIVGVVTGGVSYIFYELIFKSEFGLLPAFLIGACAACISPTATSSIIRQYKAKGPFVERVFQNILVCNIVAILVFSIILGLASSGVLGGGVISSSINPIYAAFKPLITNILLCGVAILFAFILGKLNNYRRTNDSRIILVIAFATILVCLCTLPYDKFAGGLLPLAKISPILPGMAFGIVYYNVSKSEALFIQLDSFLPPVLCLFFVFSGAKLDLTSFANASVVVSSIVLVLIRTLSQFGGLYTTGKVFRCASTTRIYLTLTMLTMTSVAVGLVSLAESSIIENVGSIEFVYTVVLSACIILEIIGPILAKLALVKTGSVDPAMMMPPRDPKLAKSSDPGNVTSD